VTKVLLDSDQKVFVLKRRLSEILPFHLGSTSRLRGCNDTMGFDYNVENKTNYVLELLNLKRSFVLICKSLMAPTPHNTNMKLSGSRKIPTIT
jgi:hypothetical protein